ncbi:putative efflux pump antibiotic resistance protein [Geopyxis carbonaria]|nr:putative efflux pump antibiotic resistance protein [Geopyxis carbonaria]
MSNPPSTHPEKQQPSPPASTVAMVDLDTAIQTPPSTPQTPDTEAQDADAIVPLTGVKLYGIFIGLALVVLLVALDVAILATAIPRITSDLHSIADVGWYGSVYLLSACSLQPLSGKIYQQFSLKWTFLSFLALFELGSLICGIAPHSYVLIIGRGLAGAGSAGLFSGALTIMAATIALRQRAAFLGVVTSMYGLATIVGPLLGGALTDRAGWRWCFYINLPCGGVTALLLLVLFHPPSPPSGRSVWQKLALLDLAGGALFVPPVVMLLLALQWAGTEHAWSSPTVLGLLLGALPLLALFGYRESRLGAAAMVPLRLQAQRTVLFCSLAQLFQMGGLMLITYFLPLWFQLAKHASPTRSGLMNLPIIISQLVTAVTAGFAATHAPPPANLLPPYMITGTAISAAGYAAMATLRPESPARAWIGYQVLAGVGRGLFLQMPTLAVQSAVPADQVPVGTALLVFWQFFGGALFVSFGQTALANRIGPALTALAPGVDTGEVLRVGATVAAGMGRGVREAYGRALAETFWVSMGAAVVACVLSWGVEWRSAESGPVREKKGETEKEGEVV